jgi:hypothetical protein
MQRRRKQMKEAVSPVGSELGGVVVEAIERLHEQILGGDINFGGGLKDVGVRQRQRCEWRHQ